MYAKLISSGSTISGLWTCSYGNYPLVRCISSGHVPDKEICISWGDLY
ncbi:MAG: hypothetical protein HXS48_08160 [Theionarchaea archaeon]|nr:hypothetical protein [Theionarchaea archaeon]